MRNEQSPDPHSRPRRRKVNKKVATRAARLLVSPSSNGGSPVAAQKQQIHEALVTAAIDVIGEQGFAATRVQTIARRAGVGYGTFYNYFSSKMALIEDVLTRIYEEIHESWYRVPRGLEPIERIRRGLDQALEVNKRYGPIITALSEAGSLSQSVNQLRSTQWERDVRDTMTLIKIYEKEGYQPLGDPYLLAMALTSMTDEVVRRWLEGGAKIPREDIVETLVTIIQSVLLPHASDRVNLPS